MNDQSKDPKTTTGVELRMIRPSEVPEYLHNSEFYKSLNVEDNEEFSIPARLMKPDTKVSTLEDVTNLLHTIRFWGADIIPTSIVQFALSQPLGGIRTELRAVQTQLPFAKHLLQALSIRCPLEIRMRAAVELGDVGVIAHIENEMSDFMYTPEILEMIASSGQIEFLRHIVENPKSIVSFRGEDTSYYRIFPEKDLLHLRCTSGLNRDNKHEFQLRAFYAHLASVAAAHGHLSCLKYLDVNCCALSECAEVQASSGALLCVAYRVNLRAFFYCDSFGECVPIAAVENGEYECLQYLHSQGYPLSTRLCTTAASADSLACLKYAHENGCKLLKSVAIEAAAGGALSCLQYYLEHGGVPTYKICTAAALNGELACLQCAHDYGCPLLPDENGEQEPEMDHLEIYNEYALEPEQLVTVVTFRQHWECLGYLIKHDYPITAEHSVKLARSHQDSLFQLAVEHGCEVAAEVGVYYAKVGNLEGLKFALGHGCPKTTRILISAARKGHLNCLIYAHENGCPWSEEVCVAAERGGDLDCFQYMRELSTAYCAYIGKRKRVNDGLCMW